MHTLYVGVCVYACVCQVIRFSIIDPLVTPIAANNSTFSVVCIYVCITTNCLGWGEWVGGLRKEGGVEHAVSGLID